MVYKLNKDKSGNYMKTTTTGDYIKFILPMP